MKIRWTVPASEDIRHIVQYIPGDNPSAAERVRKMLLTRVQNLSNMSYRGHRGKVEGTLETVVYPLPYIIVYRILGDELRIERIWHGAQDRAE